VPRSPGPWAAESEPRTGCSRSAADARWCPLRRGGGLVEVDVKSRAGRRGIVLPAQLAALLEEHRAAQAREREVAGSVWEDGGWMFAQPNGRPIDQTMDRKEWKRLLSDAGVRAARLHDARHTAATVWGSRSRPDIVTCGDRRSPTDRH
jgi:integrase